MVRRTQRVSELLREEISLIVQRQLRDPRIPAMISITRVETSPDLRNARIYVSVMESSAGKEQAIIGLNSATRFIKKRLDHVISLRRMPDLVFMLDDSMEKADRVLRVIDEVGESEASDDELEILQ